MKQQVLNRFWKGLFWFEPFQFNWVAKEWPVNVVCIPLVALQGCLHKTCMGPKDTKVALGRTGWPTLGHHRINLGSPLVWPAHRGPAVSPKLWASPGQARIGPVLVWCGLALALCARKKPAWAPQGHVCRVAIISWTVQRGRMTFDLFSIDTSSRRKYLKNPRPEASCPFKVRRHVPPQIFEPSGFWMQLPKDKKEQIHIFYT